MDKVEFKLEDNLRVSDLNLSLIHHENTIHTLNNGVSIEPISAFNHTTIINTTGREITVTDSYGMTSRIKSFIPESSVRAALGITSGYKGVLIVETRQMKNNNIIYTSSRLSESNEIGVRGIRINEYLSKSSTDIKYLYKIHTIDDDYLNLHRAVDVNIINIVVSELGYERVHKSICEEAITKGDESNRTIISAIKYYNYMESAIYVNILGSVVRVDSQEPIDAVKGVGVTITCGDGVGGTLIRHITPANYKENGIYLSGIEAKKQLNKKELIENKKLDVDYYKAETAMISSLTDRALMDTRTRVELLQTSMRMNLEKFKLYTTLNSKKDDRLDTAKKFTEVISMIFKLL